MKTWLEYAVRFRTGGSPKTLPEWRIQEIDGPEPEHVAQYCRKPDCSADMDALRVRTVRATEWRPLSTHQRQAVERHFSVPDPELDPEEHTE